jgi:hypothetical protein
VPVHASLMIRIGTFSFLALPFGIAAGVFIGIGFSLGSHSSILAPSAFTQNTSCNRAHLMIPRSIDYNIAVTAFPAAGRVNQVESFTYVAQIQLFRTVSVFGTYYLLKLLYPYGASE